MHIMTATMTGVDESVTDILDLFRLNAIFPFVEWGLLISHRDDWSERKPRYPSRHWIEDLIRENQRNGRLVHSPQGVMPLSLHVCGQYVRDLLEGGNLFLVECRDLLQGVHRVQLNFGGKTDYRVLPKPFIDRLRELPIKNLIWQCDGVNDRWIVLTNGLGLNVMPLFDRSGGRGQKPAEWPCPVMPYLSPEPQVWGYAGGLGPENLTTELSRIADAAGGRRVWVDMESSLRADEGQTFSLLLIRECLEIIEAHVPSLLRGSHRQ